MDASESGAGKLTPAVPIDLSVAPDQITCLECGQELKYLRRHLRSSHGISVAAYKRKWSLPWNYPVIAFSVAASHSGRAKKQGLGARTRGEQPQRQELRRQALLVPTDYRDEMKQFTKGELMDFVWTLVQTRGSEVADPEAILAEVQKIGLGIREKRESIKWPSPD